MENFKKVFCLLTAVFIFSACKNTPVPITEPQKKPQKQVEVRQEPSLSLVFDNIEAASPENLTLTFMLKVENPPSFSNNVKIESWRAEINGQAADSGFSLENTEPVAGENGFPLRLNMDITALAAKGLAPADDYEIKLITEIGFYPGGTNSSSPAEKMQVSGLAAFPGVREPVFSITAIAILQAELINTRFRVTLKIDNPNSFPVELSSFNYAFYGNGRFWADGTERNITQVPAKSSTEKNLFLMMNFIGMDRNLLDQIIALVDVNYRFTGRAQIGTGIEYLPRFDTNVDLSGHSRVIENRNIQNRR